MTRERMEEILLEAEWAAEWRYQSRLYNSPAWRDHCLRMSEGHVTNLFRLCGLEGR